MPEERFDRHVLKDGLNRGRSAKIRLSGRIAPVPFDANENDCD